MKIRPFDPAAIVVSLLCVAAFSVFAYSANPAASQVIIEAGGERWIYPLDQDLIERIPGPLGDTTIVIRGGRALVESSPCPDKLCVLAGEIQRPGQWIACLPNRVMVRIGGSSDQRVDDVSF